MKGEAPLSRPLKADAVPQSGLDYQVDTTPAERDAVAKDLGLPGIAALEATLLVKPRGRQVVVSGEVRARVTQTCVASLDEFDSEIEAPVEVAFSDQPSKPEEGDEVDPPDPIENGIIDLGHVAVEFLALALDPYPKKPGATFAGAQPTAAETSPFAALAALKSKGEGA